MPRLQYFRSKGYDFLVSFFTEFARYGSENTGSLGFVLLVDDDDGVFIEADVSAVLALGLFFDAYDDAFFHAVRFHRAARSGLFDGDDNDVTEARVAAAGATEDLDALGQLGAGVVRDL